MRDSYNFDTMQGVKNPYTKFLKKTITIRIDCESIDYFKNLTIETGLPYQTLINSYLSDCVKNNRTPNIAWK
jgi:predicted DNA binding CopG/RHH family protein